MIEIDPDLVAAWGEPGSQRLRLEVDDPVGAWAPLCDVLEGVAHGRPVVAPGGLLFRCEAGDGDAGAGAGAGDGGEVLRAWAAALSAAGVTRGRLTRNPSPAEHEADQARRCAAASWLVAWMVPRRVGGLDLGYRSLRGWRVRRFPPAHLDRLATFVGARAAPVPVVSPAGGCEVLGQDLASYARQWLEHGVTTASVLGPLPAPSPVLVVTAHRGAEMVGVGQAGEGLIDDPDRAGEVLDDLTELVLELAGDLAYAIVGVHESGAEAMRGTPFREAVPATARARHGGLSLDVLDQWVLDAGPVQLLTRHHRLRRREGVEETPLKGSELRLVRIGRPADWFAGDPAGGSGGRARRDQVRNLGRDALAACLPPGGTPLPQPVL